MQKILKEAPISLCLMSEEPNLEERLSEPSKKTPLSLVDHLKYFVVDGTSNAAIYAPVMTVTEFLSGMEPEEVGKARGVGAATAFLFGYLYNSLVRKRFANTLGDRSKIKVFDIIAGMVTTAAPYVPVLYYAGADTKEMMIAMLTGSAAAVAVGLKYDSLVNKWRMYWGLQPVVNK